MLREHKNAAFIWKNDRLAIFILDFYQSRSSAIYILPKQNLFIKRP